MSLLHVDPTDIRIALFSLNENLTHISAMSISFAILLRSRYPKSGLLLAVLSYRRPGGIGCILHNSDRKLAMEVRELALAELGNAAEVLGRGMRDNPIHLIAFGADPAHREVIITRVFSNVLRQQHSKGAILGAFSGSKLVGVCAMVSPGRCRLTLTQRLSLLPVILPGITLGSGLAALRWLSVWGRQDPHEPHWHIGPVGVERELQGTGIGTILLKQCCERIDKSGKAAYLETGKPQNVRFFERFGFHVVAEQDIFGIPN